MYEKNVLEHIQSSRTLIYVFVYLGLLLSVLLVIYHYRTRSLSTNLLSHQLEISPSPSLSRGIATLSLSSQTRSIRLQSIFTVSVDIDTNNIPLNQAELMITYDPQTLQPLGIIPGRLFPILPVKKIEKNTIHIRALADPNVKNSAVTSAGSIAQIQFLPIQETQGTLISWNRAATSVSSFDAVVSLKYSPISIEVHK